MTTSANALTQLGIADQAALKLGNTQRTIAGVGTAQTGAANITVNVALLTTSGGATAFVFPTTWEILDEISVFNTSATTALVFPQSGGNINGGSTDASISVAQNQGVTFIKTSATDWKAIATNTAAGASFTTLAVSGAATVGSLVSAAGLTSTSATGAGIGYATGAGGAVTQGTNRTTGVTLNTLAGAITLISAAGSATARSFTVTNSTVAATDTIIVNQKSGTDLYEIFVTAVGAGSFQITSFTTGGTTTEQPVFNFAVIKAVAA